MYDKIQGFMRDELKEEVLRRAVDGRLSCAVARNIAEALRLPYKEVGAAANELGIKIKNCELGCF
jgi:hypothetical protein